MTDVSEADVMPQTNGFGDDGLDEDERTKIRPADIDADMREMERRKRVEMIMSSRLFREELERIIEVQMKDGGGGPAGLLQQISDMMGVQGGRLQSANFYKSSSCVIPINDIRGVESMGYAKGEKILRCKLAAVYRLMDLYGWTQNIYNHITARLNQDQEHFLVNPFGMLYHEVTASSLVKVDMQGQVVEPGTTNFGVNAAAFRLHAAVHAARPDLKCVIHLHTPSVLAVSSVKCGLLPLSQESIVIGEVSQHSYLGSISEPEEQEKLARDLGPLNKVMFLSNHGAVCCGETIEEAFYNVYNTVLACETQLKLMPVGIENLQLIPDETRKQIYDAARNSPEGTAPPISQIDKKEKKFRIGGLEYEALMRMLDNAGFRTGYIYRQPLVKGDPPKPRNDVEVPPAVSSLGYLLEEEEMYKNGNWKKYVDGRKTNDRTRWLNSPNVYQKIEIMETGTPDPKKITKWVDGKAEEWVAEGSPQHNSTPVKIEHALQFVPKNTNSKEFKKLQQLIKENRRADKITSGPQSHILEGVSWEEAKKLQDANISQTGDQVILVGAASKGIIQRGFQHNATVYKAPYAKNPFDAVSDQEIEDYKRVITRKQRGESSYDEDQSESEALSSSAALPPSGIKSPASETEEESKDGPRVLKIETKQVPRPSQAEVVLSDEGESQDNDLSPTLMQRSKSSRYPVKDIPGQLNRSNSLGPKQRNVKDGCGYCSGHLEDERLSQQAPHSPPPCQSQPQVVTVSTKYTKRPLPCEVIILSPTVSERDKYPNFDKKNASDLFNNELKNKLTFFRSTSEYTGSKMDQLLCDSRRKINELKEARKNFFNSQTNLMSQLPEKVAHTSSRKCLPITDQDQLDEIHILNFERTIIESVQYSEQVLIDETGEKINDNVTKEIEDNLNSSFLEEVQCNCPGSPCNTDCAEKSIEYSNIAEESGSNQLHIEDMPFEFEMPDSYAGQFSPRDSLLSGNSNQYLQINAESDLKKTKSNIDFYDSDASCSMFEEECCIERDDEHWKINKHRCTFGADLGQDVFNKSYNSEESLLNDDGKTLPHLVEQYLTTYEVTSTTYENEAKPIDFVLPEEKLPFIYDDQTKCHTSLNDPFDSNINISCPKGMMKDIIEYIIDDILHYDTTTELCINGNMLSHQVEKEEGSEFIGKSYVERTANAKNNEITDHLSEELNELAQLNTQVNETKFILVGDFEECDNHKYGFIDGEGNKTDESDNFSIQETVVKTVDSSKTLDRVNVTYPQKQCLMDETNHKTDDRPLYVYLDEIIHDNEISYSEDNFDDKESYCQSKTKLKDKNIESSLTEDILNTSSSEMAIAHNSSDEDSSSGTPISSCCNTLSTNISMFESSCDVSYKRFLGVAEDNEFLEDPLGIYRLFMDNDNVPSISAGRAYSSDESFLTTSIESLPCFNSESRNIDDQDLTSEGLNSAEEEFEENVCHKNIEVAETKSPAFTTFEFFGSEYEEGCDGKSVPIFDTELEPFYKMAEKVLTSSSSSVDTDSLDYRVVLPINKPSYYTTNNTCDEDGHQPDNRFFMENSSSNGEPLNSSLRFDVDSKVPTFIVFDADKFSKSKRKSIDYSGSNRKTKVPAIKTNFYSVDLGMPTDDFCSKLEISVESKCYSDEAILNQDTPDTNNQYAFFDGGILIDQTEHSQVIVKPAGLKGVPQSSPLSTCETNEAEAEWTNLCNRSSVAYDSEEYVTFSTLDCETSMSTDATASHFEIDSSFLSGGASPKNSTFYSVGYEGSENHSIFESNVEVISQFEENTGGISLVETFIWPIFQEEPRYMEDSFILESSYVSTIPVDDEICDLSVASIHDSSMSYSDSLLSEEEEINCTTEPSLQRSKQCCLYSPLSFKKGTQLAPIPERDDD